MPHLQVVEMCNVVDRLASYCAKNSVFAIELFATIQGDEELAAIGVWSILIGTC